MVLIISDVHFQLARKVGQINKHRNKHSLIVFGDVIDFLQQIHIDDALKVLEEFSAVASETVDSTQFIQEAVQKVLRGTASAEEKAHFQRQMTDAQPDATYDFSMDEDFWQLVATLNPVATTLFYEQFANAVFTYIVGMLPSEK